MFSVITTASAGKVTASMTIDGKRRQKTLSGEAVSMLGVDARHGAAAGALLNTVLSDVQKAKVRHPSGAQRVQQHIIAGGADKMRFVVNV